MIKALCGVWRGEGASRRKLLTNFEIQLPKAVLIQKTRTDKILEFCKGNHFDWHDSH
jgi:hypothetical protein